MKKILNAIFRLFHSLKGTATFLDFQAIIGVTHEAETLLDIFRKGKAEITPYHVDLLCRTTDFVRSILEVVERRFSDEGFEEETESLKSPEQGDCRHLRRGYIHWRSRGRPR